MQMHYPTLLPDESLYNLAARFARLNGYWNHLSATIDLMGSTKAPSIADCAVSYKGNSTENLGLYGDAQYIQETLTTQLLAQHLGESPSNQHSDKQSEAFLESIYGLKPSWRICEECAEKHLNQYGVKYWQRTHQLPTSIVCHRHAIALTEFNLPRRRLHDHLWLPNDAPIKSKVDGANLSTQWQMITQIGYDGLQDKSLPHTPETIKNSLLIALRNKGLVTNQNRLLIRKFSDNFDEFFGENFKHEMRFEVGIKNPTALLKGVANGSYANPLYRIILVYWLFGTWEFFKQTCKWVEIFKYPEDVQSSKLINENSNYQTLTYKARKACLAYLDGSINPTRNEFIKNHYRDFNWLLRHDRDWLDLILPIVKSWKQMQMFN